jgi:hypothetical protein
LIAVHNYCVLTQHTLITQALVHADDTAGTLTAASSSSSAAAAVTDKLSKVLPRAGCTTFKAEGIPSGDLSAPPRSWQVFELSKLSWQRQG